VNAQVFAEWLRRQGHRVVRTESSCWYDAGPRVYQAFPHHYVIRPGEEELALLLRRWGAIALRYSTPLDAPLGRVSYHVVCEDRAYALAALDRRARQGVRRGLERCRVEPIPLDRLARDGWQLEAETCRRQGRRVPFSQETWRRRCQAAAILPGFEAWAALVDGRMVASLLSVQIDDCYELIAQQCLTAFLDAHVNSALTFVVTREASRRPQVRSIFYTLQSLDAPASVDVFKFRMGYVARPVRQRVLFHPWLAATLGPRTELLVHRAAERYAGRRTLTKADGMIRFCREGMKPASEQAWPACIAPPPRDAVAARAGAPTNPGGASTASPGGAPQARPEG
jgi:hypothetical protein